MSLVNNIETVIPQRMPFVMISELIHSDDSTSTSTFEVKSDNIFLKDRHLQEPALVENIAQTAAARAGYMASQEQRPVAIGYIAAIQNLEVLEADLDEWLKHYNEDRPHSGRYCYGKTPMQTFLESLNSTVGSTSNYYK